MSTHPGRMEGSVTRATRSWLLAPLMGMPTDPPWEAWYARGPSLSLVIRAETGDDARKLADSYDEDGHRGNIYPSGVEHPWLFGEYSSCRRVS